MTVTAYWHGNAFRLGILSNKAMFGAEKREKKKKNSLPIYGIGGREKEKPDKESEPPRKKVLKENNGGRIQICKGGSENKGVGRKWMDRGTAQHHHI